MRGTQTPTPKIKYHATFKTTQEVYDWVEEQMGKAMVRGKLTDCIWNIVLTLTQENLLKDVYDI